MRHLEGSGRLALQPALEVRVRLVLAHTAWIERPPGLGELLNKSEETAKALSKTCRSRLRARNTAHADAIAVSLDLI